MVRILQMIGSLNVGGSQTMILNLYRNIDREKIQFDFVLDHPDERYFAADVEALMAAEIEGETVEAVVTDCIHVMGENTQLARVAVAEAAGVASYIHGGGKIGVLVSFDVEGIDPASEEFQKCGRDVAMQVAAVNPVAATRDAVPADVVEHEKAIYMAQAAESGKPENIQEKMATGRLEKFFKENCLTEQAFVKNPDQTVAQYVEECAKALGGTVAVKGFVRFALGE